MQETDDKFRFGWMFLLVPILLFFWIFFISYPASERKQRVFPIEDTIGRANRVIAVETSDKPYYRWVFSAPYDYIWMAEGGEIPMRESAHLSYGAAATLPKQNTTADTFIDLSEEEWVLVEQWKTTWCSKAPVFLPIPENTPYYTIALRCRGYQATVFHLVKGDLPAEIGALLVRASSSTKQQP